MLVLGLAPALALALILLALLTSLEVANVISVKELLD
jgi:hypothetical protein